MIRGTDGPNWSFTLISENDRLRSYWLRVQLHVGSSVQDLSGFSVSAVSVLRTRPLSGGTFVPAEIGNSVGSRGSESQQFPKRQQAF